MIVSEIRSQHPNENDLIRPVFKRIYEEWDAARAQWKLKKIAFITCEPEVPMPSDNIVVAVEPRHG